MTDAPVSDGLPPIIADTVKEARATFDLKERLMGRPKRSGAVTLFLDEVTGNELGENVLQERENGLGMKVAPLVRRNGVLGELADLQDELQAIMDLGPVITEDQAARLAVLPGEISAAESKRDALIATMEETALVVELRAVPPIIRESARRNARKHLSITVKGIPADLEEDFNRRNNLELLSSSIVSITDKETGGIQTGLSVEDCEALVDYLPESEYVRLSMKMHEVVFKSNIADSVTGSADF